MICPCCNTSIDDKLISKHLASKGGKAGSRKISPEAQAKMQAGRKKKKEEDHGQESQK